MSEFRDVLEAAARRYPSKRAFADELGITPGRLSRVLGGEHSLDVLNCLKLAKMTGESPTRVLRVAGKREIAEMIEQLYGPGRSPISPSERELLDEFEALTPRAREALRSLLNDLRPKKAKQKRTA